MLWCESCPSARLICWSPNSQGLRTWLYLEIESLQCNRLGWVVLDRVDPNTNGADVLTKRENLDTDMHTGFKHLSVTGRKWEPAQVKLGCSPMFIEHRLCTRHRCRHVDPQRNLGGEWYSPCCTGEKTEAQRTCDFWGYTAETPECIRSAPIFLTGQFSSYCWSPCPVSWGPPRGPLQQNRPHSPPLLSSGSVWCSEHSK